MAVIHGRGADMAGLAHGFGDGRAGCADAEHGLGALDERGVKRIERQPLVVPPYYLNHSLGRKCTERRGGGFWNRRDRIIVKADAALLVDELEAMGQAVEAGDSPLRF